MGRYDEYIEPTSVPDAPARNRYDEYIDPRDRVVTPPLYDPNQAGIDWIDVGKSVGGGVGRGAAGLGGSLGAARDALAAGFSRVPYLRDIPAGSELANPEDVRKRIEGVTGPFYEPKTVAGKYASTVGEFAPSALIPGGGSALARGFNVVVPALATEGMGQIFKDNPGEPIARFLGGLTAGVVSPKLVTPAPRPTAQRLADVALLDQAGVPLWASERTGSKLLGWAEAAAHDMPLSSGAAQARDQARDQALNRAVTNEVFDRAELTRRGIPPEQSLPSADVWAHGIKSLQDTYTDLSRRNVLRFDRQLGTDLVTAENTYLQNSLPTMRASGSRDIMGIRDDIVDALRAGGGRMSGETYQSIRSRLGNLAEGATNDAALKNALKGMQGALDNAMQRNLSPADQILWAATNARYANMKRIAPAVAKPMENMTPAGISAALRAGRAEQYAKAQVPVDELASAAARTIKPLPQSGTAPRSGWMNLFGLPAALTGGVASGAMIDPVTGLLIGATHAAPNLVSRFIVSDTGQRLLANQAIPMTAKDLAARSLAQQYMANAGWVGRGE